MKLDDRAGAVVFKHWLRRSMTVTAALEKLLRGSKTKAKETLTIGELRKILGEKAGPRDARGISQNAREKERNLLQARLTVKLEEEKKAARERDDDSPITSTTPSRDPPPDFARRPLVSIPSLATSGCPTMLASHDNYVPPNLEPRLSVEREPHPVTKCKVCFLCHDKFHGQSHQDCADRSLDLIFELIGINSGPSENFNRGMCSSNEHSVGSFLIFYLCTERNANNPMLKHCSPHTFAVYTVILPHHRNVIRLVPVMNEMRRVAEAAGKVLGNDVV